MKDWMRTVLSCPDSAMPAIALTAPNSRTAFWSFVLMRFLPQISLRNLRKLDCYANRFPPPDQVRGYASLENAFQVPTRSPARCFRSSAITDNAVMRPVLGFSEGMFSIDIENRAA